MTVHDVPAFHKDVFSVAIADEAEAFFRLPHFDFSGDFQAGYLIAEC